MTNVIPVIGRTLRIQAFRHHCSNNTELPEWKTIAIPTSKGSLHPGLVPFTDDERELMPSQIPSLLPRFKRLSQVVNQVRRNAGTTEDIGLDVTLSDFIDVINSGDVEAYILRVKLREHRYCSEHKSYIFLGNHKYLLAALLPGCRYFSTYDNVTEMVSEGLEKWDGYRSYVTKVVEFLVTLENMAGILRTRIGYIGRHVVESEWEKYKVYYHNFLVEAAAMLRDSPLTQRKRLLAKIISRSDPLYDQSPVSFTSLSGVDPDDQSSTPKRAGEPLENDKPPKRQRRGDDDDDDVNVRV